MKKLLYFIAGCLTTLALATSLNAAEVKFSDVKTGDWFASAANDLKTWGVANGYADGTFGGNNNVTRGEMAVMLSKYDERREKELLGLRAEQVRLRAQIFKTLGQEMNEMISAVNADNKSTNCPPIQGYLNRYKAEHTSLQAEIEALRDMNITFTAANDPKVVQVSGASPIATVEIKYDEVCS